MTNGIASFIVAALAGTATALPQAQYSSAAYTPSSVVTSVAVPSSTAAAPPAASTVNNSDLIAKLKDAPTAVDRFKTLLFGADGKLLSGDDLQKKVVFDFNNPTKSAGGAVAAANIANFPILTDLDIATTVAFLGPCGMNTPHIHPRATEFLTVVEGSIDAGFILENGFVAEVASNLKKFQGTVFPMGSIHYQVNNNCEPATFVATLNSEDPGTSQIAQNFFGLNGDVVSATLGFPATLDGKDIETFRKSIPANLALGIDKCLAKCNIKKSS